LLARSLFIFAILFALAGYPLPAIRNSLEGEAWGHLKPLLAGSAIYKTSPIVDRFWASNAPAGGMTVLNIATLGMSSIASILERMICVPILPRLARLASIADYSSVRTLYRTCCWRVGTIAVIIFIALWLARPVWEVLAREVLNLNPAASHDLWLMCVVLTAYLIPAATGSAIAGSFYALGDSRTVVKVGVAGFVASILIKGAAFAWWGVVGLAAATLVHYLGNMLVLAGLLERRLQHAPANHAPPKKDYGRP
jgi:peptidoglycan biosynthesis protein MviN/MurJ (putative lipid II flippase)